MEREIYRYDVSRSAETLALINRVQELNVAFERVIGGRSLPMRTKRDNVALIYWSLSLQHHRAILVLAQVGNDSSAFAMLRVFLEAALKGFVAMYGTDRQVDSLRNGTYRLEPKEAAQLVDSKLEARDPLFSKRMQQIFERLHGFTHGGMEQILSQFHLLEGEETFEVRPVYTERDICDLIAETVPPLALLASFLTEFFGLVDDNARAIQLMEEYYAEIESKVVGTGQRIGQQS